MSTSSAVRHMSTQIRGPAIPRVNILKNTGVYEDINLSRRPEHFTNNRNRVRGPHSVDGRVSPNTHSLADSRLPENYNPDASCIKIFPLDTKTLPRDLLNLQPDLKDSIVEVKQRRVTRQLVSNGGFYIKFKSALAAREWYKSCPETAIPNAYSKGKATIRLVEDRTMEAQITPGEEKAYPSGTSVIMRGFPEGTLASIAKELQRLEFECNLGARDFWGLKGGKVTYLVHVKTEEEAWRLVRTFDQTYWMEKKYGRQGLLTCEVVY
ncbi:hypothetical protein SAICODRAFT_4992 [Saitoella complicata NRRL Y-17804]|uniref:Uncharacterized protein n=1 Tax=Saitoella complicata (strain BCRC 22490 / CBS 7301 / JCM 7358 / NBRC 10748 / NRRL Y-17804) TaxID=698492 RepID=A0A0E9N8Q9_SAICN|nr:uncharacterized protein SAICODRAFT_4992 [Saitoella complicata NRRL Y-17804]ODQ55769.1 hypothetical protein SAICODRAFT_4992 [Saitoella complicata NRRL Y-17804]GAO46188.1 hypothetical protein G7K_0425-t1 [Saitoella complicata NRRL Y-17804]